MEAEAIDVATLDAADVAAMFRLFDLYYDNVSLAGFERDLAAKQRAILLREAGGIVGFTTLGLFDHEEDGAPLRILFSGDTIVRRDFWGSPVLTAAWIREIGRIAAADPSRPLYWLLIVKGHRTYRLLPTFGLRFVPHWQAEDPGLARLRDAVAAAMFGSRYDRETGILRFERPRGNLRAEWAFPSPRERGRPEVDFFLRSNPGFVRGDELVCLCPLARDNMRPYAQRLFDQGFAE